jgi:hypothetical protein
LPQSVLQHYLASFPIVSYIVRDHQYNCRLPLSSCTPLTSLSHSFNQSAKNLHLYPTIMKAISIIFSLLVATSQISSTFAQAAAANPDAATTSNSNSILINVVANDFTAAGVPATPNTPILALTQPIIKMGTGNGVGGAGLASVGVAGGTILYTPVGGFTGMVTFTYMIPITGLATTVPPTAAPTSPVRRARRTKETRRNKEVSRNKGTRHNSRELDSTGPALTGTVTVTVLAEEIRPHFRIGNQFSTDSALATVDLSNAAALINNAGNIISDSIATIIGSFDGV